MIYTLFGEVLEIDPVAGFAVIDCGGVGYKITVSANTISKLPMPTYDATGETVKGAGPVRVWTYLAVREDDVELFGFSSKEELEAFKMLISVSGIGPKAAMSILSLFTPDKFFEAIIAEDTKGISRAPGVGGKTAARVVLELRDKVVKTYSGATLTGGKSTTAAPVNTVGGNLSDARDALLVLGYSRAEIMASFKNVDPGAPTEKIIKDALAVLMKQ